MSLVDDVRKDIKAAKRIRAPWWVLLCVMIGSAALDWMFDHIGKLDLVLPTLTCLAAFGFVIFFKWELRRYAWFWVTITIIAALHVPLIWLVPWTTSWVPALAAAAVASADVVLILWALAFARKLMTTQ